MELYLLRHAEAVARGTPGCESDSERPLTPLGKKRMRRVAKGMKRLGLVFDRVLTSPYLRARQTAQIAIKVLKAEGRLQVTADLAVDGDREKLIRALKRRYPKQGRILLVGHEPYLSQLFSRLLIGNTALCADFKKSGLAKLTVDFHSQDPRGTWHWFLPPGVLERLGQRS